MTDEDPEQAGELLIAEAEDVSVDEAVEAEPEKTEPDKKGLRSLLEWVLVIGIALLVALGIRHWVFQPFWIPSGSMEDTLVVGDRVLVNKLSYKLHDVHRGDVVVFEHPDNWDLDAEVKDLIKRVIGLPGDTITIRDEKVYVNGSQLIEPYVYCSVDELHECTEPLGLVVDEDGDGTFVVPDGMVFVMGDNRNGSQDSRVHGFVPQDDIVGRAFVVIWPIGNWQWL